MTGLPERDELRRDYQIYLARCETDPTRVRQAMHRLANEIPALLSALDAAEQDNARLRRDVETYRLINEQMRRTHQIEIDAQREEWRKAALAERSYADEARAEGDRLAGQLAAVRELRSCLGAGPMDYELFVDELDVILAALAAAPEEQT